jgi:hypothetical protein
LESEKVLEPQVLSAALTPTLIDTEEPVIKNEVIEEPAPAIEKINIEDFNGELLEDLDLEIKPVAKEVKAGRQGRQIGFAHGFIGGIDQADSHEDIPGAQGYNEGRQAQPGDQKAIDPAANPGQLLVGNRPISPRCGGGLDGAFPAHRESRWW